MIHPLLPPGLSLLPGPATAAPSGEASSRPAGTGREGQGAEPREHQAPAVEGAPEPGRTDQPGAVGRDACLTQALIFLPVIFIIYFLLIRPQQKQEKLRRQMLSALRKGDRVVTTGGIHGTIASLSDREAILKLDSDGKLRVKVDRSAIGRVLAEAAGKVDELSPEPPRAEGGGGEAGGPGAGRRR